jgi:hypothetical protein
MTDGPGGIPQGGSARLNGVLGLWVGAAWSLGDFRWLQMKDKKIKNEVKKSRKTKDRK